MDFSHGFSSEKKQKNTKKRPELQRGVAAALEPLAVALGFLGKPWDTYIKCIYIYIYILYIYIWYIMVYIYIYIVYIYIVVFIYYGIYIVYNVTRICL